MTKSWQIHRGFSWLLLFFIVAVCTHIGAESIHHDLRVRLEPQRAKLSATDNVLLHPGKDSAEFTLRSSLNLQMQGAGLEKSGYSTDVRKRHYRIYRLSSDEKVQLHYRGNITSNGLKGIFNMPDAVFEHDGVYNDGPGGRQAMYVACQSWFHQCGLPD